MIKKISKIDLVILAGGKGSRIKKFLGKKNHEITNKVVTVSDVADVFVFFGQSFCGFKYFIIMNKSF